jgi:hypothetical protein
MGLFSKKTRVSAPKAGCDMCGSAQPGQCNHVAKIDGAEPAWLPAGWRSQAPGEYTFLCTRCNSFPDAKWPDHGGADAGMTIHLGAKHHVGLTGLNQDFNMISAS